MVYVDKLVTYGEKRWCHLVANSTDELHLFADNIGLKRSWFQPGGMSMPHYDLTPGKRAQAVAAGAKEIDRGKLVDLMKRHRGLR